MFHLDKSFTVIGENIHATRVLMRTGNKIVENPHGYESVLYKDVGGDTAYMTIPDDFKETQVYKEGRVKHFMIAVSKGTSFDTHEIDQGMKYISAEVARQEKFGAHFLDLNIDEISYKIDVQIKSMQWLVKHYCSVAKVPPSIDSSNIDIIKSGLETYSSLNQPQGPPLVNSASLERLEVLDLVKSYGAGVVVTASGDDGMPSNAEQRCENVDKIIAQCERRNIPYEKIHIDPLLFPISVDQSFGTHYLDAVKILRDQYGYSINITGGLSNVSFGLPARRLINDTYIRLAMDVGVDSGIINPVESRIDRIMDLDMESEKVKIAKDLLLGRDEFCMEFISSFREGKLK